MEFGSHTSGHTQRNLAVADAERTAVRDLMGKRCTSFAKSEKPHLTKKKQLLLKGKELRKQPRACISHKIRVQKR